MKTDSAALTSVTLPLPRHAGWPSIRRSVDEAASQHVWAMGRRTSGALGVETYQLTDARGRPGFIRATRDPAGPNDSVRFEIQLGRPEARDRADEHALASSLRQTLHDNTLWTRSLP